MQGHGAGRRRWCVGSGRWSNMTSQKTSSVFVNSSCHWWVGIREHNDTQIEGWKDMLQLNSLPLRNFTITHRGLLGTTPPSPTTAPLQVPFFRSRILLSSVLPRGIRESRNSHRSEASRPLYIGHRASTPLEKKEDFKPAKVLRMMGIRCKVPAKRSGRGRRRQGMGRQ